MRQENSLQKSLRKHKIQQEFSILHIRKDDNSKNNNDESKKTSDGEVSRMWRCHNMIATSFDISLRFRKSFVGISLLQCRFFVSFSHHIDCLRFTYYSFL